jgi:hypothetical protein
MVEYWLGTSNSLAREVLQKAKNAEVNKGDSAVGKN